MCSKKYFVRLLPFFATFLIGVVIASIFVPLGRPGMRGHRYRHFEEDRQIRMELEQLRDENRRLKESRFDRDLPVPLVDFDESNSLDAPVPPVPVKPAKPRVIK